MKNETLVAQYQQGDRSVLEDLIKKNRSLIYSFVNKYSKSPEDREDLFHDGVLALIKAANNFDKSKGVKFATLVYIYCMQSSIKWWRKKESHVVKIKNLIESRDDRIHLYDRSREDHPDELVMRQEELDILDYRIKTRLPERSAKIINMKREGMTHQQIGEKFGISRERVRQIVDAAMTKLVIKEVA